MSASPASTTITRSRAAVATCIAITAFIGLYYLSSTSHSTLESGDIASTNPATLHRSNAISRRRQSRRNTNGEGRRIARRGSAAAEVDEDEFSVEVGRQRVEQRAVAAAAAAARAEDAIFEQEELREISPGDLELDLETVIDEDGDDWANEEPQDPRSGQNVVQLLFRVSEEATKQSSYVHRGCHCDSCGTVPIRGIRYRCSNCADYDLCEACEAQQLHTKTHIFYKIRVPASSFSSRQSQPPWYPGQPDTALSQLPKQLIAKLSKETGLERQEIYAYWEQFTFMANTDWRDDPDGLCLAIDRVTFDQCLVPSGSWRSVAPTLIFDRMFAFYDTNHDGLISFPEFLNGLVFRKQKDKLKRIFQGYDLDGDGYVDRKDFLRMFRSYYTMYKGIHQDLLEIWDDHTMSRSEAQQLISGRQPLSSAFGRDLAIAVGGARDARAGEGKRTVDGDLEVVDGNGVVNESGKDHGEREDVIIDAVVREHARRQDLGRRNAPSDSTGYYAAVSQAALASQNNEEPSFAPDAHVRDAHWDAMMNPPQTIDELQHNLLDNLILNRQNTMHSERQNPAILPEVAHRLRDLSTTYEDVELRQEMLQGAFNTNNWPPEYVDYQDVEFVCGRSWGQWNEVPTENRFDIIKQALRRRRQKTLEDQTSAAKNAINERWKRRQFYTDEEEGAVQPDYYDTEDDIAEDARVPGGVNHASASSPRPILSPRSRSSSKVRFAEDTDDYDIRSNPSTSSRSVPERWGGMEIPEAERDAGKDILYQVTQQAFNELLDPLFKEREDAAMRVMATKKERDRHRHMFSAPDFEQWATKIDQELMKGSDLKDPKSSYHQLENHLWAGEHIYTVTDNIDSIREQPLEELLAAAGYTISPTTKPQEKETDDDVPILNPDQDLSQPPETKPDMPDRSSSSSDDEEDFRLIDSPVREQDEEYIDPTLPQNRPNTIIAPARTPAPRAHFSRNFDETYVAETVAPWSVEEQLPSDDFDLRRFIQEDEAYPEPSSPVFYTPKVKLPTPPGPSKSRLYLLRSHDKYEQMAKEMGGWGRLGFEDWEKKIKAGRGKGKDGGKGGFEYLGSWIDMCIP